MLANPSEQNKLITINQQENGRLVEKRINFEEYKKLYPKHYDYFTKLHNGEIPLTDLLSYSDPKNYI